MFGHFDTLYRIGSLQSKMFASCLNPHLINLIDLIGQSYIFYYEKNITNTFFFATQAYPTGFNYLGH